LAIRAEVAVSTLRKIESGRVVEPGFFTMLSLADALGVELQELTRNGPPHPDAAAGEGEERGTGYGRWSWRQSPR
jgi:transcriptional regulator with XRE-family HTH domain